VLRKDNVAGRGVPVVMMRSTGVGEFAAPTGCDRSFGRF